IHYRIVTGIEEIEAVVQMQIHVWGDNNVTPLAQLVASIHNGGIVIGAYEGEKLVGFCYGFPGFEHKETYLCSHMLGILPEYRDRGIGKQLKLEQRKWAL
ncbi:GNAT family N-acetyltransferase, partial [Microbacteriaceae bacterium K1510]|nr:GNAT family N-acetyltransferase [Microbacteriaceae bacterium K1510]